MSQFLLAFQKGLVRVLETAKPFYSLAPLPMVHDSPRPDSETVAPKIDSPQLRSLKKMKVSKMLSLSGQDSCSQTAVLATLTPLAAHPLPPTSQSKGSICFSSASVCKGLAPALAPWSLDSALARSALGPAHLGKMQTDTLVGLSFCLSQNSQAVLVLLVSGPSL